MLQLLKMLEPPPISEATLAAALRAHYGLAPATFTFLPLGADAATWVYRLEAVTGAPLFLKLRRGAVNRPAFLVPRFLADQGIAGIMAALPTTDGGLWTEVDGFTLALYPFVEGTNGTDAGMAQRHWVAYGAAVRAIHDAVLPPSIAALLRREAYRPPWRTRIEQLAAHLAGHGPTDAINRTFAAAWHERRTEIDTLLAQSDLLAQRLRDAALPQVLCHADIHTWNLLLDASDQLWVVDWDEVQLAPKECDLLFAAGGIGAGLVGLEHEGWFFAGYGETRIDPVALAYYRHERALSDMVACAEDVFTLPGVGPENKRASLEIFESCFRPGNIVTLAGEAVRSL